MNMKLRVEHSGGFRAEVVVFNHLRKPRFRRYESEGGIMRRFRVGPTRLF
jgi:hypothetical protein